MERAAAGGAERGERPAGPWETRKWTSGLCSAGSGGRRGEPATGNKGSERGKPLRLAPPKTEVAVKCFPVRGRGGPAGSCSAGRRVGPPVLGGDRDEGFRGKCPCPFQPPAPPLPKRRSQALYLHRLRAAGSGAAGSAAGRARSPGSLPGRMASAATNKPAGVSLGAWNPGSPSPHRKEK